SQADSPNLIGTPFSKPEVAVRPRHNASRHRTLIEIELSTWPWSQFIVPVPMKHMGMQREVAHFGAGDHTARRVPSLAQLRLHPQAGRGARVADQIDHGLKGAARTASPVLLDVAEEAMLDLVP